MIELDGSHEEGGGALVRVALALSVLTGKEFHVTNIRLGREQPGLKPQHLTAIQTLKEMCQAQTNPIEIGSTELYFTPGKLKRGTYEIDIGTAGSISLLLQALILPSLFATSKITLKLKGGTCGLGQAPVEYLQNVLLPHLNKFVQKIELKVLKRGYYPKGGGEIVLEVSPKYHHHSSFPEFWEELQNKISKINLIELGKLEQIRGIVDISAELAEKQVAERIKKYAEDNLNYLQVPINIRIEYVSSLSPGGDIVLWALFSENGKMDQNNPQILASDVFLEKNKSSEEIGKEVALKLKKEIEAEVPVDHYLLDQLIPFLALLPGSEINVKEISKHALTNVYVVEKFLPVKFKIEKNRIIVEKIE